MTRARSVGPGVTSTGPRSFTRAVLLDAFSTGGTAPPAPTVTSVTATSGFNAGNIFVIITGTALTGATSVTFGGAAATSVVVVSSTTIHCRTPAHSGTGAVTVAVTTPGGTGSKANAYTYTNTPTLTSLSPTSGGTTGGTAVTLTGTHFAATVFGVTFGTTPATTVVRVSTTSITCKAPAHAVGVVTVTVSTSTGRNPSLATSFTYNAVPTVTSVTPGTGFSTGATAVTVHGTHLTGATAVTFGGTAATTVVVTSSTTITCKTPAHAAGAVTVAVTTPVGTGSKTTAFTYLAPVPVFVKSLGTHSGTATPTLTVTYSATPTATHTVIIAVACGGTNTITGITDNGTTPNTYVPVGQVVTPTLPNIFLFQAHIAHVPGHYVITSSASHNFVRAVAMLVTTSAVGPSVVGHAHAASTSVAVALHNANATDNIVFAVCTRNGRTVTASVGTKRVAGTGSTYSLIFCTYQPGTVGPHTVGGSWSTTTTASVLAAAYT